MITEVFSKVRRITYAQGHIGGFEIGVSNTMVVTWIIMAILVVSSIVIVRKMSAVSTSKAGGVVEILVETVNGLCKSSIGHLGKVYVPYIGTLLLFLGVANIITVFNFFPFINLYPPTKDINVTGGLAVMSIAVVIYSGFRYLGFKGWAKSLIKPTPVMAPFKIMEYGTKPLSLCLRLFGNILASFIIMELLYAVAPIVAAPFSAYFDLFDGLLQAFIFTYLTTIYIGEAVEE
ncbi:ATP synthase subunit a [Clostridia bacterium]|nr:ATP synthase subunit a [Clostridia bacterium]